MSFKHLLNILLLLGEYFRKGLSYSKMLFRCNKTIDAKPDERLCTRSRFIEIKKIIILIRKSCV